MSEVICTGECVPQEDPLADTMNAEWDARQLSVSVDCVGICFPRQIVAARLLRELWRPILRPASLIHRPLQIWPLLCVSTKVAIEVAIGLICLWRT